MLWIPDIIARVTLSPTSDGGRQGPTPSECFSCPMEFENEYFDVRLDLTSVGSIAPGDTVQVPAKFLCPELVKSRLSIGSKFTLWDGREIGRGQVIEIIDHQPDYLTARKC